MKGTAQLLTKQSLTLYTTHIKDIQEIKYCENDEKTTMILIRYGSNTLKLNYRNRHTDGNTHYTSRNSGEDETLQHFILYCEAIQGNQKKKPGLLTRKYPKERRQTSENLTII